MTIAELVKFTPSAIYRADPSVLQKGMDVVGTADGFISCYHGVQINDGNAGYIVNLWRTFDKRLAFSSTPAYELLLPTLKSCSTTPPAIRDVRFPEDAILRSLNAPIFELATVRLQDASGRDALEGALDALCTAVLALPGVHGCLWGATIEGVGQYVLAVGWESAEVHHQTVADMKIAGIISRIHRVAEVDMALFKMAKGI